MFHSTRRAMAAVALGVCVVVPQAALAASKMAVSVQGKGEYTVVARMEFAPGPGQIGEFTGTLVEPGKLPSAENNFSGGFGQLPGVVFTRLAPDTITAVDAKGSKFWIILKAAAEGTSASISDGTDILAKGEFSGAWFNDTGEAGARSIPLVLASFFAQQTVAAEEPAKPTLVECHRIATLSCTYGIQSLTWSAAGTCSFVCKPTPPQNPQ